MQNQTLGLLTVKVPACGCARLRACDEAKNLGQTLRIGQRALTEYEVPDPNELVFEFLEAMFQPQIALAVGAHYRVDVGLGDEVGVMRSGGSLRRVTEVRCRT